jgi:hypothetical protein
VISFLIVNGSEVTYESEILQIRVRCLWYLFGSMFGDLDESNFYVVLGGSVRSGLR